MVGLGPSDANEPRVVDRRATPHGELALRRVGNEFEIIHDGTFLMDTRNGESERRLVTAALDAAGDPTSLLIGGLGVGFSLDAALSHHALRRVVVVELHDAVVEWSRTHLVERVGDVLDDDRVEVVVADIADWVAGSGERFDAVCLDVDNGPDWLSVPSNDRLYAAAGLAAIARLLTPSGALAIWSASRSDSLRAELERRFVDVSQVEIEVPRGEPDVVYVAGRPIGGAVHEAADGAPGQPSSSRASTNPSARPT